VVLRSLARCGRSNVFNSIFRESRFTLSVDAEIVSEIDVAENNVPFSHDFNLQHILYEILYTYIAAIGDISQLSYINKKKTICHVKNNHYNKT